MAPDRNARLGHASGSSDVGEVTPLAEAKLAAPRHQPELVKRPRIMRQLDATEGIALTLVSAPPGYGKTTAVRAWCAARQITPAWVTLDAGDNDPVRLWTYVATAVDRVRKGLASAALQRLRAPGVALETVVDELTNGIAAFGKELVIVLDDVQTVTDPGCLASIDHCLVRLPPNARVILVTRADPGLQLARLRVQGGLTELRASELAFTSTEARELLVDNARVELGPDELALLRDRTEGWAAALVLAGLWLRTVEDAGRAVREFGGDQRFVAEYLTHEVLGSLADDRRWFLLRACVLGRFTPELCDAVLDRTDSSRVLAELARTNLLVVRLERGGWFRVHTLFAGFAESELASVDPGAAIEIHGRAAEWLRSRGMPVEAAEHALAAGNHALVAQLLVEHHLILIRSGAALPLLRWARALPEEQLLEHPELSVAAATAATMLGRSIFDRQRFLLLADRARRERPDRFSPYAGAVAGMVHAAAVDRDVGHAVAEGERSVAIAESVADDVLVAALAGYARALYFAGDLDAACAAARNAVEHPHAERRAPGHAFAHCTLALASVELGKLISARRYAEKAKSIVGRVGGNRSWLGANAAAALGSVLAAEGALVDAERELAHAEHLFRDELPTVHHAWALVVLARVRCRRGRLDQADTAMREAREAIGELADVGRVAALAAEVEREIGRARTSAGRGAVLELPTEAERAVLRLLVSDLTVREIGAKLFLSPNTVRSHTRAIYRKLGVNSRAAAVARGGTLGLLERSESPM